MVHLSSSSSCRHAGRQAAHAAGDCSGHLRARAARHSWKHAHVPDGEDVEAAAPQGLLALSRVPRARRQHCAPDARRR